MLQTVAVFGFSIGLRAFGGFLKLGEPVARPKQSAGDAAAHMLVPGCVPELQCLPGVSPPVGGAGRGDRVTFRRARGPPDGPPDAPEPRIISGSHGKGSGAPGSALSCLGRLGERLEKIS